MKTTAQIGFLLALAGASAHADRVRVLPQIDLPHDYYYREMYLPQLTTGPSAATFSPDGRELIYTMGGSLWRQTIGSDSASELTHGDGYDYQPDWSSDGRHVVFARYAHDAIELWQLDLKNGREVALTHGSAVNVEPRYAPDGRRIAFVSTSGTGHFNLFVAGIESDKLDAQKPLVYERKSDISRYYYSPWDHALSPAWTPDGKTIVFVGNHDVAYGTGGLWKIEVGAQSAPRPVLTGEETAWRARPQVLPDGNRVLYSSFHGRQWHQLWLTTLDGAPPLPLTFGDFDRTDARVAPDGSRIAYISNEGGNTSLWLQDMVGGARQQIIAKRRHYKLPTGEVNIIVSSAEAAAPARISVIAADGRAYAPDDSWMLADDGYDRSLQAFENHYFHCFGPCTLTLPRGKATITVAHGLDYAIETRSVEVTAKPVNVDVPLHSIALPERYGAWTSADLHVHMNYGGHYRHTLESLAQQARAEHLDVIHQLVVNKEERFPDIANVSMRPYARDGVTILPGQEYHTSYWGHLGLVQLDDHLLLPGFSAYALSALASPYPYNGVIADLGHQQHALIGYVHPFDETVVPDKAVSLTNALPADVAHGKVDYYEVVGFSDHKASAAVWYRLLNLGFHLPAGAGTDAMGNYASLRGPVGMNRVFLNVAAPATPAQLKEALRAGRTFATNSALLGLEVAGRKPGDTLEFPAAKAATYHASLRSIAPIDHCEILYNGRVVATAALDSTRTAADVEATLNLDQTGWVLLRAWNDHANPRIQDIYPYATTSPIYVKVRGSAPQDLEDARFFVRWLERAIESAAARSDYNSAQEKADTLEYLRSARAKFQAMH